VAFDFYKTSNCLPAAEELKAGLYDVKVLDFVGVRPKVLLPPFGEDREENQAVSKHQEGGITWDVPKEAVQGGSLGS